METQSENLPNNVKTHTQNPHKTITNNSRNHAPVKLCKLCESKLISMLHGWHWRIVEFVEELRCKSKDEFWFSTDESIVEFV